MLYYFLLTPVILFVLAIALTVEVYLATFSDAMEIASGGDLSTEVDTLEGDNV